MCWFLRGFACVFLLLFVDDRFGSLNVGGNIAISWAYKPEPRSKGVITKCGGGGYVFIPSVWGNFEKKLNF